MTSHQTLAAIRRWVFGPRPDDFRAGFIPTRKWRVIPTTPPRNHNRPRYPNGNIRLSRQASPPPGYGNHPDRPNPRRPENPTTNTTPTADYENTQKPLATDDVRPRTAYRPTTRKDKDYDDSGDVTPPGRFARPTPANGWGISSFSGSATVRLWPNVALPALRLRALGSGVGTLPLVARDGRTTGLPSRPGLPPGGRRTNRSRMFARRDAPPPGYGNRPDQLSPDPRRRQTQCRPPRPRPPRPHLQPRRTTRRYEKTHPTTPPGNHGKPSESAGPRRPLVPASARVRRAGIKTVLRRRGVR